MMPKRTFIFLLLALLAIFAGYYVRGKLSSPKPEAPQLLVPEPEEEEEECPEAIEDDAPPPAPIPAVLAPAPAPPHSLEPPPAPVLKENLCEEEEEARPVYMVPLRHGRAPQPNPPVKEVNACLPCEPDPCNWRFNPCDPKGTTGNLGSVYLSADLLYWMVDNSSFAYAFSSGGNLFHIKPTWRPGLKAGIGWSTPGDFWDIFFNYLYINNHAHEQHNSAALYPLFPVAATGGTSYTNVEGDARFLLNFGDMEVGRITYITRTVSLRPYWGARGGTIHQKLNNTFTGASTYTYQASSKYWGLGPRLGLDGAYLMARKISLLGKFSGSLLYGKMNTTTSLSESNYYTLSPNLNLQAGFEWQSAFYDNTMLFKLNFTWESNVFFNQFSLPVQLAGYAAPLPGTSGLLSTQGFTLRTEWDF